MTKKKIGPFVHGIFANDFLLPWDDHDKFAALHENLKAEWFPKGPSEEQLVFDLAQDYWIKGTLSRLRTAKILSDPFTREIAATKKKSWAGIRNVVRRNAKAEHRLRARMEASVAEGFAEVLRISTQAIAESNAEEAAKLSAKVTAITGLFTETFLPWLERVKVLPDAEEAFDKNYSPDALEKVLRLEALVDARITKHMTALVSLKEFKRTPAGSPAAQLTPPRAFDLSKHLPAQH